MFQLIAYDVNGVRNKDIYILNQNIVPNFILPSDQTLQTADAHLRLCFQEAGVLETVTITATL